MTNTMPFFKTSDSISKIDEAIARVQAKVRPALKDSLNPHFKSRYADLASVWEACRDALTSEGVSVTQWPVHAEDGHVHMITRLAFQGEWIMAESSLPVQKADPQGYVSGVTYLRRTCLAAAVGIVADDDDGNAAAKSMRDAPAPKPSAPVQQAPAQAQAAPLAQPYPFLGSDAIAAMPSLQSTANEFKQWCGEAVTKYGGGDVGRGRLAALLSSLAADLKMPGGSVPDEDSAKKFRDEFFPKAKERLVEAMKVKA